MTDFVRMADGVLPDRFEPGDWFTGPRDGVVLYRHDFEERGDPYYFYDVIWTDDIYIDGIDWTVIL